MKTIGIPGWKVGENSFGVTSNYLEFAKKYGNPRIIMPWEEYVEVDLLILPGGKDISPSLYGQVPGFKTSDPDVFKEFFYTHRLKNYVEKNVPIFGICLGFQQLGIYFGSKLEQNTNYHAQSPDRWEEAHDVYNMEGKRIQKVNSHHHQYFKNISEDLEVIAVAFNEDTDNKEYLVEAFKHKTLKIAGVQWHPEEFYDELSDKLIKQLYAS